MASTLRVLIVEDLPSDAELAQREIAKALGPCEFVRVETSEEYLAALETFRPSLIVSDFLLPKFDGLTALRLAVERLPDIPFIVLTGSVNEDVAVQCIKAGAWDYVVKEHITRLGTAVRNALEEKRTRDERRAGEVALRKSEEDFRRLFESSVMGVSEATFDGRLIRANLAYAEMFGYPSVQQMLAEVTDIPQQLYVNPADRTKALQTLGAEGSVGPTEIEMVRRDGSRFFVLAAARVIPADSSGGVDRFQATHVDITRRRRAEETLRGLSARHEAVLAAIPDIIVEADVNDNYIWANRAGVEFFGDDVVGSSAARYFVGERVDPASLRPLRDGSPDLVHLETWQRRRDGELRLVDWWGRGVPDAQGAAATLLFVGHDITERARAAKALQESEVRFREFFENQPDYCYVVSPEGIILDVNRATLNALGYAKDELVGRPKAVLYAPECRARAEQAFHQWKEEGRVKDVELTVLAKDGEPRLVLLSASAVRSAAGEILHSVSVQRDITERRSLARQLEQAQKMESIGRLAGGVAHDFNNILSVILSYADFVAERIPAGDPAREDIEEIKKAAARAAALTRQLLAFSRKQVLRPDVLDLNAVVEDIHRMVGTMVGEDILLTFQPAEDLWATRADRAQIEQVIMNLAVNARDAMPNGGKLTIETANVDLDDTYARRSNGTAAGPYVMLAMTDTGCGMDAATQTHLFEPFFTTKPLGKGTGLGLATVYGVVKQSGGSVEVDSAVGQGTKIRVYLPRFTGVREVHPRIEGEVRPAGGSETVLIVEDEEPLRILIRRILVRAGYKALTAADGEEALRVCEQLEGRFDLLLTDVIMPGMSGRELAERLTAIQPHVRVVYMSGYTGDSMRQQGMLDPGLPYVEKPFLAGELIAEIRRVLDTKPLAGPAGTTGPRHTRER